MANRKLKFDEVYNLAFRLEMRGRDAFGFLLLNRRGRIKRYFKLPAPATEVLSELEKECEIFIDWDNRIVGLAWDEEADYEKGKSSWNLFGDTNEENLEIFLVRRRLPRLNSVLKKLKNFTLITPSLDISLACSPKYLLEQLPEVKKKMKTPFIIIGGCDGGQSWRYLNNYMVKIQGEDATMVVNFTERVAELEGIWLVTPKYITNSLRLIPHSEENSKILKAKGNIVKL